VKVPGATPVAETVQEPDVVRLQLVPTVPTEEADDVKVTVPDGVFAGVVVSATVTVQVELPPILMLAGAQATLVEVESIVTVTLTDVEAVVAPRGVPVTIRVNGPVVVDAEVPIVKTLDPVGLTGLVAKLHVTPVGRGVTHDKVTGVVVPAVKVAVIVTVPELPRIILRGPLFDNE
jgi:hypothetical protein